MTQFEFNDTVSRKAEFSIKTPFYIARRFLPLDGQRMRGAVQVSATGRAETGHAYSLKRIENLGKIYAYERNAVN